MFGKSSWSPGANFRFTLDPDSLHRSRRDISRCLDSRRFFVGRRWSELLVSGTYGSLPAELQEPGWSLSVTDYRATLTASGETALQSRGSRNRRVSGRPLYNEYTDQVFVGRPSSAPQQNQLGIPMLACATRGGVVF